MNAVGVIGMEVQQTIGAGARVVVVDPDADARNCLRQAVRGAHLFVLAGAAPDWRAGVELIDIYVPELLILRDSEVPAEAMRRLTSAVFPLVVSVSNGSAISQDYQVLSTLTLPLDSHVIAETLEKARTEIYARKAIELSQLLDRYLSAAYLPQQYISCLKVDDQGRTVDIPTDDVVSIAADGNYVRVHTGCNTYEMRETMSGLSEKLDPRSFVRAHRSFIVNLSYVHDVVDRAGASSLIVLHNGSEIPVGPNYRNDISESLGRKLRLTA